MYTCVSKQFGGFLFDGFRGMDISIYLFLSVSSSLLVLLLLSCRGVHGNSQITPVLLCSYHPSHNFECCVLGHLLYLR